MKEKNIVEHSQCGVTNLSSSLTDLFVFLAEMTDSLMMLRLIPSNISKNPDGETECVLSKFLDET